MKLFRWSDLNKGIQMKGFKWSDLDEIILIVRLI